jgi:hypothetical protein
LQAQKRLIGCLIDIGSASLLLCLVTFALARNIALLNGNEAGIVTSKASEFVAPCTVTQFQDIPSATKSCTDITIQDVTVPGAETLDLSKLKKGTKITFAGTTVRHVSRGRFCQNTETILQSFEFAEENVDLIQIGGTDITVEGAPGHVLDGNGQAWWDGIGMYRYHIFQATMLILSLREQRRNGKTQSLHGSQKGGWQVRRS